MGFSCIAVNEIQIWILFILVAQFERLNRYPESSGHLDDNESALGFSLGGIGDLTEWIRDFTESK